MYVCIVSTYTNVQYCGPEATYIRTTGEHVLLIRLLVFGFVKEIKNDETF